MLQHYWMINTKYREIEREKTWRRHRKMLGTKLMWVWWSRVFWHKLSDACVTCLQFVSRGIELTNIHLYHSFLWFFIYISHTFHSLLEILALTTHFHDFFQSLSLTNTETMWMWWQKVDCNVWKKLQKLISKPFFKEPKTMDTSIPFNKRQLVIMY